MEDKELLKRCHEGDCICDGCERRFVCWTTKRVFSEPTHQALYEAYVAEGHSHEDAIKEVEIVIQRAIMEAAMREAAKRSPKPEFDKIKKWDEWKDGSWKDVPHFPHYDKWVKWQTSPDLNRAVYDITKLPVDEAKEEVEGLTKYFRSVISGKSTKR